MSRFLYSILIVFSDFLQLYVGYMTMYFSKYSLESNANGKSDDLIVIFNV